MSSSTNWDLIEPFYDSTWLFLDNRGETGYPTSNAFIPLFDPFGFHVFVTARTDRVFCFHQLRNEMSDCEFFQVDR
jgi:hypothetical protein